MEKLMNEENGWDHNISAGVKESPADCIRINEVAAALKKMKRRKALCLSLVRANSRNDNSHRGYWNSVDIGFMYWFCERLHSIELEVWYYQSTKRKVTQQHVGFIEGLTCFNML